MQDKEWIIVIGSKYENGKIIDPSSDRKTADDIKENSKKANLRISSIKRDTDIYFSEDRPKNLIVVEGVDMNRFTSSIHDKLSIQSIKIQKYNEGGTYEDYLVNTAHNYLRDGCSWVDKKYTYSIQVIKNPHKSKDTCYIIVVFGLIGKNTEQAGKELVKLGENRFEKLDETLCMLGPTSIF